MAGANPSKTDGRGRNAFFTAFNNRDMTKHWFINNGEGATRYNQFWHDHRELYYRQDSLVHNRIKIVKRRLLDVVST